MYQQPNYCKTIGNHHQSAVKYILKKTAQTLKKNEPKTLATWANHLQHLMQYINDTCTLLPSDEKQLKTFTGNLHFIFYLTLNVAGTVRHLYGPTVKLTCNYIYTKK